MTAPWGSILLVKKKHIRHSELGVTGVSLSGKWKEG